MFEPLHKIIEFLPVVVDPQAECSLIPFPEHPIVVGFQTVSYTHLVVDLLFGEDPDTVRSGLFVESLAVGVVVRISEERPIESEVVIGFNLVDID